MFQNLVTLEQNLNSKSYKPGKSICFAVKYPKLREIFAAEFKDRVVHHLLVKQLEPSFERRFIYDSFACRKNKGGHLAQQRLQLFLKKLTANFSQPGFYLQLDISNFFGALDKAVLNHILQQYLQHHLQHQTELKKDLSWLTKKVIFHDPTQNYHLNGSGKLHQQVPKHKSLFNQPPNKGMPIGNLTSQFFANVYLNQLDQFVKRKLKAKFYLRYADDMVFLTQDKSQLKYWHNQVKQFLGEQLKLKLNPSKTKLNSIYQGINFVGYIVKPEHSYVRQRTVVKLKTQLEYFNQGLLWINNNQRQEAIALENGPTQTQLQYLQMSINSYYGHFLAVNSYRLRKHLYQHHFGKLKQYLKPVGDYHHFVIKNS